jgi:hypothetical protein
MDELRRVDYLGQKQELVAVMRSLTVWMDCAAT